MTRIENRALAAIALCIVVAVALGAVLWRESARYFPASELDAKPFPMRRVDLDFPPARNGIEYYGKLRLDVFINAQGGVDRVDVLVASVPAAFSDAAVKAFSEARWEPGRRWGRRVKSVKAVEIDYDPPVPGLDRPVTQPDR